MALRGSELPRAVRQLPNDEPLLVILTHNPQQVGLYEMLVAELCGVPHFVSQVLRIGGAQHVAD
eukprot:7088671-Prymnesium_polylepis.1